MTTALTVSDDGGKVADVMGHLAPRRNEYAGVLRMLRHRYEVPPSASYVQVDGERFVASNFLGDDLLGCYLRLNSSAQPMVELWLASLPFDTVGLLRQVEVDGVSIASDEIVTGTVPFRELIPMIMSLIDHDPATVTSDARVPIEMRFDGTTLTSWAIDEEAVERESRRLPVSAKQRKILLDGLVEVEFIPGPNRSVPLRTPSEISPDGVSCGESQDI